MIGVEGSSGICCQIASGQRKLLPNFTYSRCSELCRPKGLSFEIQSQKEGKGKEKKMEN
jgi:hypothetical protein